MTDRSLALAGFQDHGGYNNGQVFTNAVWDAGSRILFFNTPADGAARDIQIKWEK